MKEPTRKEKFQYWFDNQMAKGSLALIKLLTLGTWLAILLISCLYFIICGAENGFLYAFWDSFASVVDASIPLFADAEGDWGYLIFMTFAGLTGLLVTSVLIGIISSGIEEKVTSLRQGNSRVLEKDHTVVVGFTRGEYTLVNQLILANENKNKCIVVACTQSREDVEENIKDNIEIPSNIRIIVRSVDIFDPVRLEKCSLSTASNIIISPTDDKTTTKILLAISRVINSSDNEKVHVGAIIQKEEYKFPESVAKKHNVTTLQTNEVMAKIIAHSCTMPGLSQTFIELFNFEGSEMYSLHIPEAAGLTFLKISEIMDDAVPVGILRDGHVMLNPDPGEKITKSDNMIIFAESREKYKIRKNKRHKKIDDYKVGEIKSDDVGLVAVLGYNDTFSMVLKELPYNVTDVLVESKKKYHETIRSIDVIRPDMDISIYDKDIRKKGALEEIAMKASHIVLLSDPELSDDEADLKIIFRIMQLRDIREKNGLSFNITAEMNRENNQRLIEEDDNIDFVVASNLSSLFLAQLAESPELIHAFNEILSNVGNEIYIKPVSQFRCRGKNSVRNLRRIALANGYIFLGHLDSDTFQSVFNLPLEEIVELKDDDKMIVLGQQ